MHVETLELLRCPRCAEPLRTESVLRQDEDDLVHAITACACTRYPIVEGILVLNRSGPYEALTDHLIRELGGGSEVRVRRAVGLACIQNGGRLLRWSTAVGRRYAHQVCRVAGLSETYRRAIRSIDGARYWEVVDEPYYRFRFSSDSLRTAWPSLPVFEPGPRCLIDAGCGHGHVSFLISKLLQPRIHFCLDRNLASLILARNIFAPQAQMIALDLGGTLPFPDGSVDALFSMDTLHYVQGVRVAASEFNRVLEDSGLFLGLHMHNALGSNPEEGKPLPWNIWPGIFPGFYSKLIPEPSLIEDFLEARKVQLDRTYDPTQCSQANAVALVAAKSQARLEQIRLADWSILDMDGHWSLNPVYSVERSDGLIRLTRQATSEYNKREYPVAQATLPRTYELPGKLWDEVSAQADGPLSALPAEQHPALEELIRKGILLALPRRYR